MRGLGTRRRITAVSLQLGGTSGRPGLLSALTRRGPSPAWARGAEAEGGSSLSRCGPAFSPSPAVLVLSVGFCPPAYNPCCSQFLAPSQRGWVTGSVDNLSSRPLHQQNLFQNPPPPVEFAGVSWDKTGMWNHILLQKRLETGWSGRPASMRRLGRAGAGRGPAGPQEWLGPSASVMRPRSSHWF